jgi:hypothetical protein
MGNLRVGVIGALDEMLQDVMKSKDQLDSYVKD